MQSQESGITVLMLFCSYPAVLPDSICFEGNGATTPAMTTRPPVVTTQPATDLLCHKNDPLFFQKV